MTERPIISERLLYVLNAWIDWLNSGDNPAPRGMVLSSISREFKTGRGTDETLTITGKIEIDEYAGVRANDAYIRLAPISKSVLDTHVRWSAYSPLTGMVIEWPKQREHEARRAQLTEAEYELLLADALRHMETFACA